MSKIRLGEPIFRSVQGEGNRTGVLSVWVRFFGCNLKCDGFMQREPTKPETYFSPIKIVPENYKSLSEVPILPTGCDSGYSWNPKFKHLAINYSDAASLYKEIDPLLYDSKWEHPLTKNSIDLCFTGGEPMMQQDAMVEVMKQASVDKWRPVDGNAVGGVDYPETIQIETNGTKKIEHNFSSFYKHNAFNLNWNVSPKLHTVSGEVDAVKYDIIESYFSLSSHGCIKFVVNDSEECWQELNKHAKVLARLGMPIMVMPVGATYEHQTNTKVISKIANRAIAEGYHVSGRLHAILFGNTIGS